MNEHDDEVHQRTLFEQAHIVGSDVVLAYGPLAKAFVVSRVNHAVDNMLSREALDFWGEVATIVWEIDPDWSAGCPLALAQRIRLH